MRTLLCGLLSILILFNSALPSLAQVPQLGRTAVSNVRRTPTLLKGLRVLPVRTTVPTAAARGAGVSALGHVARPANTAAVVSNIQRNVSAQVLSNIPYENWKKQSTLLAQSSSAQESQQITAQIFSHAGQLEEQSKLFRNELSFLIVTKQVSAPQIAAAKDFYRRDILHRLSRFSFFKEKDAAAVFSDKSFAPYAKTCQDVLSSAAALALCGEVEDASLLVRLHDAAKNTPFETVATRLTARGLLKIQAYEAFEKWAAPLAQEGEFWLGLEQYIRQNELPVSLHPKASSAVEPHTANWVEWLEAGNVANGLNAEDSLLATQSWMALGKKAEPVSSAVSSSSKPADVPAVVQQESSSAQVSLNASLVLPQEINLQHSPLRITAPQQAAVRQAQSAASATPATQAAPAPTAPTATVATAASNDGILYSGFPIFALAKAGKKVWEKVRGLWHKKQNAVPAVREEPGLHENTVRPVFEPTAPSTVLEAEDVPGFVNYPSDIEAAESGFKLTLENEQGVEHILRNVDLTIDTTFKIDGYNRLVLKNDNVFELRNLTQPAGEISHFFVELENGAGELYRLAQAVDSLALYRPMRIKLERKPNVRYTPVFLAVEDFETGVRFNLQATVDKKLLPENVSQGKLLLTRDGKIYFASADMEPVLLEGFYVRLPKEESPAWTAAMKAIPDTSFNLKIYPTDKKTNFMTYIVSPLRIGTGKAFGPIMSALGLPSYLATGIPLFANNGLSVLLGPFMPLLRRIGEANMYRLGVSLYAAASTGALALGLNGFMGVENATAVQTWGLVGVLMAMGFGGILINVTQNNLVSSNAGAVRVARSAKMKSWAGNQNAVPTLSYLGKRFKEVFTTKDVAMRDSVRYQWLSAFKNVGTFGFLSLPLFFNLASEALGSSVRADFSLSFWALAGLSSYALYKVLKMPMKDSVPRNAAVFQKMVVETEHRLIPTLMEALDKPEAEWQFGGVAKQLNGVLAPYARALSYKSSKKKKELALELEGNSVQRLHDGLLKRGVPEERAQQVINALQKELDVLGRRNVGIWKVMRMKGVRSALAAMTLLTVHELGTSSEFAYQVGSVAAEKFGANGTEGAAIGMFLTAFFLYGTSFFSRVAGNWVALRTSEGTMYAFSSLISVLGTGMLIGAHGNLFELFSGAILATFGMGNFFSQMFEHTIKQAPKFRPELAVLIGYTMPLAAGLTSGVHTLAEWGAAHGVHELGLISTLGALLLSFIVCPKMFADSSIIRSIQHYGKKAGAAIKRMLGLKGKPADKSPLSDGMRTGALKYK